MGPAGPTGPMGLRVSIAYFASYFGSLHVLSFIGLPYKDK